MLEPVECPSCGGTQIAKHGNQPQANTDTSVAIQIARAKVLFEIILKGYLPTVKRQLRDIAINGSGSRDTAHVLKISPTTVIEELQKERALIQVNEPLIKQLQNLLEPFGIQHYDRDGWGTD